MRHLHIPIVIATVLIAVTMSPARAQCPDDVRLRVQSEIDLTDVRIEQAETILSALNNSAANTELGDAVRIQGQAKSEFSLSHCRIALDLTLRARLSAAHAVAIARGLPDVGVPDPSRVLSQLDRTQEQLERARDRIEECDEDRARSAFHAALDMQERAEMAFHNDRFLAALQLTVSARERALRALRQCHVQENLQESADRALKRTDDVLARALDQVGTRGEAGKKPLARARELQDRAYREFRAQHFEASLRLTQSARTFAYRAIRQSNGT